MAIDPISLRVNLSISTPRPTEGLAGAFLYEFLTVQQYQVERQAVSQPEHETPGAERFNVYAALPGITPDVVLSTHMELFRHTLAVLKTMNSYMDEGPAMQRESLPRR